MSRKKLGDNEDAFIKGSAPSPQPAAAPANTSKLEETLKQALQPEPKTKKEATVRFTADLPIELHSRLAEAAASADKSKVKLVREILEAVLPQSKMQ